ncbi:MAG: hypothetical protein HYT34_00780 [Candidatus Ryanbacteria bacterium]|nr:hypothetical protein [Candidatus Ryanbacteria bacterium]
MEKILVFASGTKDGGGSGFEALAASSKTGILGAEIVMVVSNHESGGVRKKAAMWNIPFRYYPGPYTKDAYQKIFDESRATFVALSGWLKKAAGLDPKRTVNIHPGPLPHFGGKGMYGMHVHEAVIEAFRKGELAQTAVSMHFVTEEYDEGPVFFHYPILIFENDTPETLSHRVWEVEHAWQPWITNLVVSGQISWDGKHPVSLRVPPWYTFHKQK